MLQTPTRTGRLLSIRGAHTWQLSLLDLSQAMKSLQLCQPQASENGPDTTERAPLDARVWGAVRVPGSTRHQDARMSLVFVSGSDWPPAPARFNAPRGGLRAASIRNKRCVSSVSTDARATFPGLILGAPCRRLQAIIARGTSVVLSISHEPSAESHGRIRACCCETLHEHWVT